MESVETQKKKKKRKKTVKDDTVELLTYKIDIKRNFIIHKTKKQKTKWYKMRRYLRKMLKIAMEVAKFVIYPKNKKKKLTSASVKHITQKKLKSCITNQIIRKYQKNKKIKKVKSVNLIVPVCSTVKYPSVVYENNILNIIPLKMKLKWIIPKNVEIVKINQVELNEKYAYVCVSVKKLENKNYNKIIGIDLNIKHNLVTVGSKSQNICEYLGKGHIMRRVKYKHMRSRWQKQKKESKVKEMGNKENRIMSDLNNKICKEIIDIAIENQSNITFEKLTNIRNVKSNRRFRYFLHSWAFYDLQMKVVNKSKLLGLKTYFINPRYTSQDCSRCGSRYKTTSKKYICKTCNLIIHRDKNACFNIELKGLKKQIGEQFINKAFTLRRNSLRR